MMRNYCAVLVVTNSIEEVEAISTNLYTLNQGKLKYIGSHQIIQNMIDIGYEVNLALIEPIQVEIYHTLNKLNFLKKFNDL